MNDRLRRSLPEAEAVLLLFLTIGTAGHLPQLSFVELAAGLQLSPLLCHSASPSLQKLSGTVGRKHRPSQNRQLRQRSRENQTSPWGITPNAIFDGNRR